MILSVQSYAGSGASKIARPAALVVYQVRVFCSKIGTRMLVRESCYGTIFVHNQKIIMKIVVAISGASGAIYGLRLLERLFFLENVEIHLILTRSGEKTLFLETGKLSAEVKTLSHFSYSIDDIGCRLASGSYPVDAMVVAPCSIHTMSAIAQGISSNLLVRAADVALKERRKLILLVRESPFHLGHLRNMAALCEMGAIIAPPIPGFYNRPQTVMDIVDHSVDRILDLLGVPDPQIRRWEGK
jgi:4-hydroxy-3-polyprenylbenzoate decarboxylase